ncbi:helix-turn-helix domain-containing protein [Dactylosporangium sp. CS-047395]|uniref:helix-turn-helix domain-containing protein n=1 Tax=Dactylosporangium sp. CS-047395 TaxID=3239936 RepID=UPI003D8AC2C9
MDDMARKPLPTLRLRRLAAELRSLRSAASLSREAVEERTGITGTTLYRLETAKVRPQRRTLNSLLDLYNVTDAKAREDLHALSRKSGDPEWLQSYQSELTEQYMTYIAFEQEAREVRNFESLFVPGLLQTEAYATAVIAGVLPTATPEEVANRVRVRLQRQRLLEQQEPLRLWAVVDEAAFRRTVGGSAVMADQLRTLAERAALPHVSVQVIPFNAGAHPGMPGSFSVLSFADSADPDIVYTDSMSGDLFTDSPPAVRRHMLTFAHLQSVAVSPADSIQLLNRLVDELE